MTKKINKSSRLMSWNHKKVTEATGCLKILVDSFYFEKENHNFLFKESL